MTLALKKETLSLKSYLNSRLVRSRDFRDRNDVNLIAYIKQYPRWKP